MVKVLVYENDSIQTDEATLSPIKTVLPFYLKQKQTFVRSMQQSNNDRSQQTYKC